jgi:hypothetical protein
VNLWSHRKLTTALLGIAVFGGAIGLTLIALLAVDALSLVGAGR